MNNDLLSLVVSFLKPTWQKIVFICLFFLWHQSYLILHHNMNGAFFGPSEIFDRTVIFIFSPLKKYHLLSRSIDYFIYLYLISCILFLIFKILRRNKIVLFIFILAFMLFTGIDKKIVDSTVNQRDVSCKYDSDCEAKLSNSGYCGGYYLCVNKNWDSYKSVANHVFGSSGSSCKMYDIINANPEPCTCIANTCSFPDSGPQIRY